MDRIRANLIFHTACNSAKDLSVRFEVAPPSVESKSRVERRRGGERERPCCARSPREHKHPYTYDLEFPFDLLPLSRRISLWSPRGPISSALKNAAVNAARQLPCYPSSIPPVYGLPSSLSLSFFLSAPLSCFLPQDALPSRYELPFLPFGHCFAIEYSSGRQIRRF